MPLDKGILDYNKEQSADDRAICELLADTIERGLPKSESKIWHGSPVWFLDGNPIVGYSKLKNCVRLLFWSGQSFEEDGLTPEGSFKAAEARYTDVDEVNTKDLKRWLKKSKDIQWDYKNIIKRKGKLVVRVDDTLLGKVVEHETDMVVLGVGLVPSEGYRELAQTLKLSLSADRFFLEAHPKLRPVDTNLEGVFLAGCCQGPKDIPDTVAQAKGAASSAIALLNKGKVKVEPVVAEINEDACSSCHICEALCPYSALVYDVQKGVMTVNQILCKGCGVCPSACPSAAIKMRHFTSAQIDAQLDALLEKTAEPAKAEA